MMQNLTILSLTGSKTAVDIIGSLGAGGRYNTLCRWFNSATPKAPSGPKGDTLYVFDNEQRVGKTWSVKPNNKVKASVITNVAAVTLNEDLQYQAKRELHPSQWLTEENTINAVEELLNKDDVSQERLRKLHFMQLKKRHNSHYRTARN